jgi:hypothetical protein
VKRLKFIWLTIRSFFPSSLPQGMTEYNNWAFSIISLSKLPDNDSTRFALGSMIMHMGSRQDVKPMRFFVKQLRKAAANEIAHSVISALKEKQKAEYAAQTAAEASKQNVPVLVK